MESKLWLWKNFVDGKPEYWAFDNPYPCYPNGDPMTLGEPCGYALVKESKNGRPEVSEEQVVAAIKRTLAPSADRSRPTIAELEELLTAESDTPIEILPDGSIRAIPPAQET